SRNSTFPPRSARTCRCSSIEEGALSQLRQLLIRGTRSADADGLAAVDDEGVTDGEPAEVGAQPQGRRGDLLGSAHATDRFLGTDAGAALGGSSGRSEEHTSELQS